MRLWQFVLEVDSKLDLSSAEVVRAWAHGVSARAWAKRNDESGIDPWYSEPLWSTLFAMAFNPPSEAEAAEWKVNFFAFRKCAARVQGADVRSAAIEDAKADGIFKEFVALLSPRMFVDDKPITTIDRVRYRPRDPRKPGDPEGPLAGFSNMASLFWQMAFGSLAFDCFSGVCRECNKELGFTPKGKPRTGEYCKACINKNAFKKLPKKEQQRINREKQERHRKRAKGTGEGTQGNDDGIA
jgi:hypothetical protein